MFKTLRTVTAALLLLAGSASHAALVADYQFQGNLNSSVGAAPALANIGAGSNGFASETVFGNSTMVGTFPAGNGYVLAPTTGLIANGGPYTLVLTARLADISGYRKLFDFKNGTSDNGYYNYDGSSVFFPYTLSSGTTFVASTYFRLALVRDAAGALTGYVNGLPVTSDNDSVNQYAVFDASNTLRLFIDDTVTGGSESSGGAVSRLQVYNTALTAAEIQALGPGSQAVPALAPVGQLLLALLLLGWIGAALRR